jgi:para-nitrobenzyl esterase
MRSFALSLLALGLAACSTSLPTLAESNVAAVDTGRLRGAAADGIISFKGVPFAAPPVGALRWKPPQPATRWEGVRDASAYGAVCMQKWPNNDNGIGRVTPSEDCLTLNVFTEATSGRRPVMVWIHGGGFVNGSGTADLYDGTQLAKRGVVVVSINYRLGRFGAFAHPLLTREAGSAPTANYGMMDMIASLEWVKRNIAAFGGDPRNVTIFGESAGGMAVQRLMTSPAARGLFHKAMVQSGAGREPLQYLDRANGRIPSAESDGAAFVTSLGVTATDTAALRAIPAERIIAAGDPSTFTGGGPVLDGKIFVEPIVDAFRQGHEARVPYLVGYNAAEFPTTPEQVDASLTRILGLKLTDIPDVAATYPDDADRAARIVGDLIFAEPARQLAALHAANGAPTFLYRFDILPVSVRARFKGTPHAQERQYVFSTLTASPYPTDANDAALASTVTDYWAAFAKTGDPNGANRPAWPRYAAASDQLLEFTNTGPQAKTSPHAARWSAIARRYP